MTYQTNFILKLTEEEQAALQRTINDLFCRVKSNRDWTRTLAEMIGQQYLCPHPEEDREEARRLLTNLAIFEQDYAAAVREPQAFARYYARRILLGKTLEEQCRCLHSLICALEAFDTVRAGMPWQETYRASELRGASRALGKEDWQGPCTEQARDELLERAVCAIDKSRLSDRTLEGLTEELMAQPHLPGAVFHRAMDDHLFRAITALAVLKAAHRGELSAVPRDISLYDVCLCVSCQDNVRRLVGQLRMGSISEQAFRRRMDAIHLLWKLAMPAAFLAAGHFSAVVLAAVGVSAAGAVGFAIGCGVAGVMLCLEPGLTVRLEGEHLPVLPYEDFARQPDYEQLLEQAVEEQAAIDLQEEETPDTLYDDDILWNYLI